MVHEALGHGVASWLVNDPILSLSTVALQNASNSRVVSAAGTIANSIVGALSLVVLGRAKVFNAAAYFLWLFGAFNLFNSGYLIYSAIANGGDWANVVSGVNPPIFWRTLLALVGGALYVFTVHWLRKCILTFVATGEVSLRDLRRLTVPAYLAAGALMTAASCFNPISRSLILVSGVAASFGLNAGLLFLPALVDNPAPRQPEPLSAIAFSPFWTMLAIVVAGAFVCVLGPGIRLSH